MLAVVAVAADVITRKVAEDQFATILRDELGMSETPDVAIGGVPFLTQLSARDFRTVKVSASRADFTAERRPVTLEDVVLNATGVTASADWATITAHDLSGAALLPWDTTSEVIGATAEYDKGPNGEHRIKVTHTIEFQSIEVPVVLTGAPRYDPQTKKLALDDAQVQIATYQLPADLVQDLLSRALQPIDLGLPDGVEPTNLTPTPDGLRVQMAGTDVTFR